MLIYIFILHLFWAAYAANRQQQVNKEASAFMMVVTIVLNFIFAPICMLIALFRNDTLVSN